ncbi:MAG TPA: GNAT family N-acetyltransferase [Acidimicrobiia bacterium]|nr:GNAT family N-acetyltransferase [Acidimicrobiia bacterium]
MAPELRRVDDDSYLAFVKNMERTYGVDYNPDEDTFRSILDIDRAFGHFDGDGMVSTIGAYSLEMTIPGNVVSCGGTTVVTVSPTHRRRGLLTEMMRRHFDDVLEREEPIAALWASESEIYGRFGYGRASTTAEITVHRRGQPLSRHAPATQPVRLVDLDEAKSLLPPFHDRFRLGQPGMFRRWPEWWEARVFSDFPSRRGGATAARWAVVDGDDGIDGYAKYRTKSGPGDDGHSGTEMMITDLFAESPEGWASLWSYLLSHDLVAKFTARLRSPQDPIFDLLTGPRRAQAEIDDGLWVRVMDVPDALTSRHYEGAFTGVIKVHDPMGLAGGTFQLETFPEGSECTPATGDPDISLDIEDLGAVYMGTGGFRRLARSGRISGSDEALKAADLAFGWDPQPWCPEIF